MIIGEVVETKKAFKPDQKDDVGNSIALGSIEIRIGAGISNLSQVRNVYARPAIFNRRIPLIGEQVSLMLAPVNDQTTDGVKGRGYIYFDPINATDDLVLHQFPQLFTRDQTQQAPIKGKRKHDKKEVGYTFPKSPKRTDNLQPFEGDDIWQGRLGQSIRFGSTIEGDTSVYDKKPTWKGGSNTDPLMIFRVKKPSGSVNQNIAKYTIEDIKEDEVSIYMTTTQMINSFKGGFNKNLDVKKAGNWKDGSQVIINADRAILNAKKDSAMIIGKKDVIITGERILLQDGNYKVYLSDLMDFLKSWLGQDKNLASGTNVYSTFCGPTAVATNMGQYIALYTTDWATFKKP